MRHFSSHFIIHSLYYKLPLPKRDHPFPCCFKTSFYVNTKYYCRTSAPRLPTVYSGALRPLWLLSSLFAALLGSVGDQWHSLSLSWMFLWLLQSWFLVLTPFKFYSHCPLLRFVWSSWPSFIWWHSREYNSALDYWSILGKRPSHPRLLYNIYTIKVQMFSLLLNSSLLTSFKHSASSHPIESFSKFCNRATPPLRALTERNNKISYYFIIRPFHYIGPSYWSNGSRANMRRHFTVEQGQLSNAKRSNQISAKKDPDFHSIGFVALILQAANFWVHPIFLSLQRFCLCCFGLAHCPQGSPPRGSKT